MYAVSTGTRKIIERTHRPECVTISSPNFPDAVIRDQKPMSDAGVRKALGGSVEPDEWYALLNSMVFFWPTKARLKTMLGARAYSDLEHDVLIVDTKTLVDAHKKKVRLSHMNSGCTIPWAHPRSLDLFKIIDDFPFAERRKKVGIKNAVAEVCFKDGIDDIAEFVTDVKILSVENVDTELKEYP